MSGFIIRIPRPRPISAAAAYRRVCAVLASLMVGAIVLLGLTLYRMHVEATLSWVAYVGLGVAVACWVWNIAEDCGWTKWVRRIGGKP